MVLGKTKRSHGLLAAALCAAAFACGQDEPDNSGYQPGPGPGGQFPGGTSGGSPVVTGGGTQGGGTQGGGTQGGGTQGGVQGGGTQGGVQGGGTMGGTGAPPDLGMNSQGDTFFRAETLVLLKPTLVHDVTGLGLPKFPVTQDAQNIVNDALTKDSDNDGRVDASLLMRFLRTVDPKLGNGETTIGGGRCPFPVAPDKACGAEQLFPFQSPGIAYSNGQNCMLEETTDVAAGACFASARTSLTMNIPLLGPVPLQDGQVIGSWQDGGITNGRVRGFLPKTVAATTKLPNDLDPGLVLLNISAGMPLTNFLPDNEIAKNSRGEDGWWFVLSFTAKPAKFDPSIQ